MTNKLIWIILIAVHWSAFGQTKDTCQCRLIYGDVMYPTLVTYHHDSLVSYKRAIHLNNFKLFDKFNIDSVFRIENYKWHTWTKTYHISNGGIGEKVNNQLYIFHPFRLLNIGEKFNSYQISYDKTFNDSFLLKSSFEIVSHRQLNKKQCNCFDSDLYRYNNNFRKLDLSRKTLENIYTTDSSASMTNSAFVWSDACTFGIVTDCYLTGIGDVSIDLSDERAKADNYKVYVVPLDSNCKTFFKQKLKLDTLDNE